MVWFVFIVFLWLSGLYSNRIFQESLPHALMEELLVCWGKRLGGLEFPSENP